MSWQHYLRVTDQPTLKKALKTLRDTRHYDNIDEKILMEWFETLDLPLKAFARHIDRCETVARKYDRRFRQRFPYVPPRPNSHSRVDPSISKDVLGVVFRDLT